MSTIRINMKKIIKNKGVSLLELLISLSIMAILVSIASPNFTYWIGSLSVKNNSENVYAGITSARAEALKSNQVVEFQLGDRGSWQIVNADTNTLLKKNNIQNSDTITFSTEPNSTTVLSFDGFGKLVPNQDGSDSITKISLQSTFGDTKVTGAEIRVTNGGALNLCSKSSSSNNYCGE